MLCLSCGDDYEGHGNSKTCSPQCSKDLHNLRRREAKRRKLRRCNWCSQDFNPILSGRRLYCCDRCAYDAGQYKQKKTNRLFFKTAKGTEAKKRSRLTRKIKSKVFQKHALKSKKPYTDEEVTLILDLSLTTQEIALQIGRTQTAISKKRTALRKLKLR